MTEICTWLDKLLKWVDHDGAPTIPYIGLAPYFHRNLPAPHIEIAYYLENGIKDVTIGDEVASIPPYHLAIHSVHQGNYTSTIQRASVWCLFLDVGDEPAFAELANQPLFCTAALPLNEEVIAAYERLGSLCVRHGMGTSTNYHESGVTYAPAQGENANPLRAIRVKAALLDLLALLRQLHTSEEEAPAHPSSVQRAIEFMSLHYRDPDIKLQDISHAAALSTDHFGRLFRQHMDESPMHYLRKLRVNQARHALRHTDLFVEEIAFNVGFSDALHFSRVFRSITGMSPSNWRNTSE
jgi:AraC-like DNA-binding protein